MTTVQSGQFMSNAIHKGMPTVALIIGVMILIGAVVAYFHVKNNPNERLKTLKSGFLVLAFVVTVAMLYFVMKLFFTRGINSLAGVLIMFFVSFVIMVVLVLLGMVYVYLDNLPEQKVIGKPKKIFKMSRKAFQGLSVGLLITLVFTFLGILSAPSLLTMWHYRVGYGYKKKVPIHRYRYYLIHEKQAKKVYDFCNKNYYGWKHDYYVSGLSKSWIYSRVVNCENAYEAL